MNIFLFKLNWKSYKCPREENLLILNRFVLECIAISSSQVATMSPTHTAMLGSVEHSWKHEKIISFYSYVYKMSIFGHKKSLLVQLTFISISNHYSSIQSHCFRELPVNRFLEWPGRFPTHVLSMKSFIFNSTIVGFHYIAIMYDSHCQQIK